MSYQVLARKWRPRSFAEVTGQEHVLRALINALDTGRLHHAYLFTGTRGVGKTTLARILAKCLNCEAGVSSTPCGTCRACTEIDQGRFLDLIEIDAASRTGVDDTRELLENVAYAPSSGRFKVYLIDEVHMFSRSSFNALLKTLEEPPEHVKFVLATTDPQKIPVTVLSRCLQFNLKRFPASMIATQLQRVLEAELVSFELSALETIAVAAEGSMRDALSLLDQALAYAGGEVRAEDVQRMLGVVDEAARFDLVEALADGDAAAVLDMVAALNEFAPDYEALLGDLISLLHALALQQSVPEAAHQGVSDTKRLRALAARFSPEAVQLNYQIALVGRRDLPMAPVPRNGFQMVLLRMLAFRLDTGPAQVGPPHAPGASRPELGVAPRPASSSPPPAAPDLLDIAASRAKSTEAARPDPQGPTVNEHAEPAQPPDPPVVQSAPAADVLAVDAASWAGVIAQLSVRGMPRQLAMQCVPIVVNGNRVTLKLPVAHKHLAAERSVDRLRDALSVHFGRPVVLEIKLGDSDHVSPARQSELAADERQRQAEQAIYNDPVVRQMQNRFGATVQRESIRPLDYPAGER